MNLLCVFSLSLLIVTTQLSLRLDGEADADDKVVAPVYEFGGFFEFVGHAKDASAAGEQDEQQLVGYGHKTAESWPVGSWKAPLLPNETWKQSGDFPLFDTQQCTADDMKVLNYWAMKQAKKTLPMHIPEGRPIDGDFKHGLCWNRFTADYWMGVEQWSACYQNYYNVTTPCAKCIGKVYNMAKYNMSEPCYNFCYGRPTRKDGSHWCWEDCQQCMWYVGRKLSDCYGEPYDMVCRYAKEIGKEGYFEKNGIDPKR